MPLVWLRGKNRGYGAVAARAERAGNYVRLLHGYAGRTGKYVRLLHDRAERTGKYVRLLHNRAGRTGKYVRLLHDRAERARNIALCATCAPARDCALFPRVAVGRSGVWGLR